MYSCGPSVYLKPHIGNHRTFIFEDMLQRYLEHLGYRVTRLMTITDVEDKAITEAAKRHVSLKSLTDRNMNYFLSDLRLLRIKFPNYLPRSSLAIDKSAELVHALLKKKIAYSSTHDGRRNIYFDPLKFRGFGKLSRLDMSQWSKTKRRFHLDTYPGTPWNRGDFILWHGCSQADEVCWDTEIGRGRPAWNVQDAAMVAEHLGHSVDFACGGIDNLVRHHDYTLAIMESAFGVRFARFWCHAAHLFVDSKKMSKSRGNIVYVRDLIKKGYSPQVLRFFLIYRSYREKLNFTLGALDKANLKLESIKNIVRSIRNAKVPRKSVSDIVVPSLVESFRSNMNEDLNTKGAIDTLLSKLIRVNESVQNRFLSKREKDRLMNELERIDEVLQVIF